MTVDTTKLRELAMKATPGPWESNLCSIDKIWFRGRIQECVMQSNGSVLAIMAEDSANSDYVAAANPATMLQLIDEIDRLHTIESAARNLAKVKGRHHSEQAMNQLFEALK